MAWIPSDRFIWIGPSRRGAPRIGPSMLGFALDLSRARPLRSSRSELGDRPSPAIGHHVARPNLCFHRSGDPALVARLFWLSANHIGHTQLDSSALGVLTGQILKRRLRRDGHLRGVHRCILHLYFTGRGNQPPHYFFFDMPLVALTYNSSDDVAFCLPIAWLPILPAFGQFDAQPVQPSNCSVPGAQLGT